MTIFDFAKSNNIAVDANGYSYIAIGLNFDILQMEQFGGKLSLIGWTFDRAVDGVLMHKFPLADIVNDNKSVLTYNKEAVKELWYTVRFAGKAYKELNRLTLAMYGIQVDSDLYAYFYDTHEVLGRLPVTPFIDDFEIVTYSQAVSGYGYCKMHISQFCDFNEYGVVIAIKIGPAVRYKIWRDIRGTLL